MNNKFLITIIAVSLIAVGLIGYNIGSSGDFFGATTIGPATSAGLQSLYNNFAELAQDAVNSRTVTVGTASSTAWNPAPLSPGEYATTSLTGVGTVAAGDVCVAFFSTTTPASDQGIATMDCAVTGTGAITATILQASSTVDYSGTIYVRAMNVAQWGAPIGVQVSTSTTAGN